MHGQGGLAHAGGAGDGGDEDCRTAGRVRRFRQEGVEPVEVLPAPGEAGHVGGQLGRDDAGVAPLWRRRRRGWGHRLAAQDLLVYGLKFRAGIGTEFVSQVSLYVGIVPQRLGAASGGVQRAHQRGGQGLVERMLVGQVGEQSDG